MLIYKSDNYIVVVSGLSIEYDIQLCFHLFGRLPCLLFLVETHHLLFKGYGHIAFGLGIHSMLVLRA